jgi:hypothetical protein
VLSCSVGVRVVLQCGGACCPAVWGCVLSCSVGVRVVLQGQCVVEVVACAIIEISHLTTP